MHKLNKIESQIFTEEFERLTLEKYHVKKIEWEWSVVGFILWGSAFFVTLLNLNFTESGWVVLLDLLVLLVLLLVFVVIVGTVSLNAEWKRRFNIKGAIQKARVDQYGILIIKSESDLYDLNYVYTDNKLDYILYRVGRYLFYGTTYLVLGAITISIIAASFSKPY